MSRGGYRPGSGRPKGSLNKIPAKGRTPAKNPRKKKERVESANVSQIPKGENLNDITELQMRETEKNARSEILPGLSCSIYEEMEKNSPDVIRAEIERQLPKLCGNLLETRKDREAALRGMSKSKQRNASRRLLKAFGDMVVVQGVSPATTQDERSGVVIPLNQENTPKNIAITCDSPDAKEYLEKLLMSKEVDQKTKIQISNILLPYQHPRMGEGKGKKQAIEDRAKQAGAGRFTPGKPPLKVVNKNENRN